MSNAFSVGLSLDIVNRQYQEPSRNRCESKYYWEQLYPLIAAAGFPAVEIPYDPFWMFRGGTGVPLTKYCIEAKYQSLDGYKEHLAKAGVNKVTGVHFDPSMFMRNTSLDFYFGASGHFGGEAIEVAAELGADYVNITPTAPFGLVRHYHSEADLNLSDISAEFGQRTIEMLSGIVAKAQSVGITPVMRNEFWQVFSGANFSTLMKSLPSAAKVNFDPAHLYIRGINPVDYLADYRDRLGSAYLTDTAYTVEDTQWQNVSPEFPKDKPTQVFRDAGFGFVELPAIIDKLLEFDYQGWVIVSSKQTRDPMRTLLRSQLFTQQYLYQDGAA